MHHLKYFTYFTSFIFFVSQLLEDTLHQIKEKIKRESWAYRKYIQHRRGAKGIGPQQDDGYPGKKATDRSNVI